MPGKWILFFFLEENNVKDPVPKKKLDNGIFKLDDLIFEIYLYLYFFSFVIKIVFIKSYLMRDIIY